MASGGSAHTHEGTWHARCCVCSGRSGLSTGRAHLVRGACPRAGPGCGGPGRVPTVHTHRQLREAVAQEEALGLEVVLCVQALADRRGEELPQRGRMTPTLLTQISPRSLDHKAVRRSDRGKIQTSRSTPNRKTVELINRERISGQHRRISQIGGF